MELRFKNSKVNEKSNFVKKSNGNKVAHITV